MKNQIRTGYQLYSAREHCATAQGLRDTIKKIAAIGYDGVEFASFASMPASEVKELLAECGVEGINAHVPLERWRTALDEEIAYLVEAGIPMITLPWLPPEERNSASYTRLGENFPGWVEQVHAGGLKAAYHNHEFEYESVEGKQALEIVFAHSPKLLYELDVFWACYAGFAPTAEMEKWKTRLGPVHIKDYADMTTEPPAFCAVGHGKMDLVPVYAKAREMNLSWLVVEQDNSAIDVFDSAALSLEALRKGIYTNE